MVKIAVAFHVIQRRFLPSKNDRVAIAYSDLKINLLMQFWRTLSGRIICFLNMKALKNFVKSLP